jgi:protein AroM
MKARVGMVTIGQAPRVDVVPEMAAILGPRVEIMERGALDGLAGPTIAAMEPTGDDAVLVTRLADGAHVFVGKRSVTPLMQERIDALEADGVDLIVVLCTGKFAGLRARRPLVQPDLVLQGVLRGVAVSGRLGVLTPSARHVEQTQARWASYGFDPVVVPLSPYEGGGRHDAGDVDAIAASFRAGGAGLVLCDCIGFRRPLRDALAAALRVPVIVANLLVARVVAELLGA